MIRSARKVITEDEARERVRRWQAGGETVAFANGVFDLLHVGHVRYLAGAGALAARLVVGVNGDAATGRLKGHGRPVLAAAERAGLVAALRGVDAVVVFEDLTADRLLESLRPDFHAKGTDYRPETVPERGTSAAVGARTVITGDPKRHSSREVVARVRERHPA